ncbi:MULTISPECIES: MarR family winged helix-turn-helix transcriptional regulator [unclassified Streptomyces]|uniref:MarR family winged helix-turn-helix transcriptional regulator n=1 Tax=unclassified Streptomyces TaxID=2593676 RepID=UPI002DD9EF60|nr:MarR family winged helix-turn-helix transcriptional regulator [Streptomyces sp. NBC_01445]WSE03619.1 MarR family winged helix-turn-helix transcriptional regulator [Streptomyces sp. NBC_01445]
MPDETTAAETTPRPPAELTAAPGYQVRRLYQAYLAVWLREVDPVLTGPQFAVLQTIQAHPGRDQRSLASAVALDTSTMADVAKRLDNRGLITRQTAADDGRRKLLYLTEDGGHVLREAERRARALDKLLLEPFSETERTTYLHMLTSLADHWVGLAEGPNPTPSR